MDGLGDRCDPCPMAANPAGAACPATIYQVKSAMVGNGATVTITGPVVTAIGRAGFYAQVATDDRAYTGPDHSGVYVFTGTAPTVAVGDRVTLTNATVADYFGQTQLTGAMITATAHGVALPAAVSVMPAEVTTGGMRASALEGVLVRVSGVSVTNPNPAPAGGEMGMTNEFEITGGLRVDDSLYLTTPYPVMGENFASITGVMAFLRSNSKLLPRSADDLVAGAPSLASLTAGTLFARVGAGAGPTFPTVLTVQLARAVSTPTTVTLTAGAGLTVSNVVIPAGVASAVVPVTGVTASPTPVTVTATLGSVTRTASVRVLGANEAASVVSLTPATATVSRGETLSFHIGLDVPAPPGGAVVNLSLSAGGTVVPTVTIPANTLGGDFTVTAGSVAATGTLTARLGSSSRTAMLTVVEAPPGHLVINEVDYDQPGSDTAEFIELYNGGFSPVDLSSLAVVMVNGSNSREYARVMLSGTLMPGAYALVANTSVMVPAGTLRFTIGDNTLQNGAPDGVALIDTASDTVLDALSYEGPMPAAIITGITGTVSLVEGTVLSAMVADSNTAPGSLCRLPNGSDTDDADTDWRLSAHPSPGAANVP